MLERCTGVPARTIQAADLSPSAVWDGFENRIVRLRDHAVKYYDNLRLVYAIETQLKDLQNQAAAQDSRPAPRGNGEKPANNGKDNKR
jgi:hypothetical protein